MEHLDSQIKKLEKKIHALGIDKTKNPDNKGITKKLNSLNRQLQKKYKERYKRNKRIWRVK